MQINRLRRVYRVNFLVSPMKKFWGKLTVRGLNALLGIIGLFYAFSLYRYINEYIEKYIKRYILVED